jgi:hypothetical protein
MRHLLRMPLLRSALSGHAGRPRKGRVATAGTPPLARAATHSSSYVEPTLLHDLRDPASAGPAAGLRFHVVSRSYERRRLVLTTNWPFRARRPT